MLCINLYVSITYLSLHMNIKLLGPFGPLFRWGPLNCSSASCVFCSGMARLCRRRYVGQEVHWLWSCHNQWTSCFYHHSTTEQVIQQICWWWHNRGWGLERHDEKGLKCTVSVSIWLTKAAKCFRHDRRTMEMFHEAYRNLKCVTSVHISASTSASVLLAV